MTKHRDRYFFSGIQPTGELHIGNFLGAIKNWVALQDEYVGVFGIVDYHALTEPLNSKDMPERVLNAALDYLAAGIDPEKSILMVQSTVHEHTEFAWILNTITPVSWLQRVPTFKEKAAQFPKAVNMGLLDYPVLMAADILLYKSTIVPVGEDQLPHLELTREIARSFNARFGETFPEPEAYLGPGARVMSLTYPEKKMSKSLGSQNYIALADSPEVVRDKIAKAVTDVGPRGKTMSPGVANLFHLLELFSTRETVEHFRKLYGEGTLMYSDLKKVLADELIKGLEHFREKRARLARKPKEVLKILEEGGKAAQKIARETLREVKEKAGLLYF